MTGADGELFLKKVAITDPLKWALKALIRVS
jgi:hypothetical protein